MNSFLAVSNFFDFSLKNLSGVSKIFMVQVFSTKEFNVEVILELMKVRKFSKTFSAPIE